MPDGNDFEFELEQVDRSGNVTATYVYSLTGTGSRVDVLPQPSKPIWQSILDVFLPAGYPQSVTDDYLRYQIFDSLQAFTSSIASLLASRAALQAIGIGDPDATPTAALLLTILQESTSRLATIAFAHRLGTAFEPECKMYRLMADVLNDISMVLDCVSINFPRPVRIGLLSCSSVFRALCGLAAGSAKASLSAHFARNGNVGELNAKDSSQETVISLMGMLAGSVVVPYLTTPWHIYPALFILLTIHLLTNTLAVRAVCLRTLNRQRLTTLVSSLLDTGEILSPEQVSQHESIFCRGRCVWRAGNILIGQIKIGVGLSELLRVTKHEKLVSGSFQHESEDNFNVALLRVIFKNATWLLYIDPTTLHGVIALMERATPYDQLIAWTHAIILARKYHDARLAERTINGDELPLVIHQAGRDAADLWVKHRKEIEDKGWNLEVAALETTSGVRFRKAAQY